MPYFHHFSENGRFGGMHITKGTPHLHPKFVHIFRLRTIQNSCFPVLDLMPPIPLPHPTVHFLQPRAATSKPTMSKQMPIPLCSKVTFTFKHAYDRLLSIAPKSCYSYVIEWSYLDRIIALRIPDRIKVSNTPSSNVDRWTWSSL